MSSPSFTMWTQSSREDQKEQRAEPLIPNPDHQGHTMVNGIKGLEWIEAACLLQEYLQMLYHHLPIKGLLGTGLLFIQINCCCFKTGCTMICFKQEHK